MKDQTWAGTYPEQKRPISMETVRSSTHTSVMIFKWVQPDHEGMKTAADENGQKSCDAVADRRLKKKVNRYPEGKWPISREIVCEQHLHM